VHTTANNEEIFDADARIYDVLEMPWDVFKSWAGKGEVFSTPLIIKETSTDTDEFSVGDYADRLEQTFLEMDVMLRYHMSEQEPLPVSKAAHLVRNSHSSVLPTLLLQILWSSAAF
jgi:hypothetical protein